MVQTYKIKMSLLGRATQLPDSQKLLGALIHKYAEQYSSEQASKLVADVLTAELYLSVSNMLPEGYLPCPRQFLLDKQSAEENSEQIYKKNINSKDIYKAIKKRQFIVQEDLYKLLSNPENAIDSSPYVFIESAQQIHASIDAGRYNMPGLPPNVYSVPDITVIEAGNDKSERMHINEFCFYVAIDEGEEQEKLLAVLESAHKHKELFFLGARVSQGLNTYTISEIKSEPTWFAEETSTFLNLGMLLPHQIDYKHSTLQLFTSERRPYYMAEGWSKNINGKFISYVEAGSIIRADNGWRNTGKSIKSPFQARDIVFGNAFLLPLNRNYWGESSGDSEKIQLST